MESHKRWRIKILIICPTQLIFHCISINIGRITLRYVCERFFLHVRQCTVSYVPIYNTLSRTEKTGLSDWPTQSSDINIIKNIWSILKTTVSKFNIKSSEDLQNVSLKACNDIPTETINHLYESMPRRLQAVVKVK